MPRVTALDVVVITGVGVIGFGGVEPYLASPLSPGSTSNGSEVGGSCPAKRAAAMATARRERQRERSGERMHSEAAEGGGKDGCRQKGRLLTRRPWP